MVLQVGVKALQRRRDQLRDSAESVDSNSALGDVATVCLLLFYAAECGLKERLLVRQGQRDSAALEATFANWLRNCGCLGSWVRASTGFRVARCTRLRVAPSPWPICIRHGAMVQSLTRRTRRKPRKRFAL
jgi:hypothetical protein